MPIITKRNAEDMLIPSDCYEGVPNFSRLELACPFSGICLFIVYTLVFVLLKYPAQSSHAVVTLTP